MCLICPRLLVASQGIHRSLGQVRIDAVPATPFGLRGPGASIEQAEQLRIEAETDPLLLSLAGHGERKIHTEDVLPTRRQPDPEPDPDPRLSVGVRTVRHVARPHLAHVDETGQTQIRK